MKNKASFSSKKYQLTQEEELELSCRLELLLTAGKQVEGTSPEVDINKRPAYFSVDRFQEAQKVVNKYFLSLSSSSSVGLILLLQLDEILIPLLRTGKSRTVAHLYDRYSATALYIKKCYETSFYEPTSEGWRYVMLVRAMHQRIYKIMNNNSENQLLTETEHKLNNGNNDNNNRPNVWVNQYDMAMTQFAFTGLLLLEPAKCAAPQISDEELSQIAYYWRLLSYQLGFEDRFNLFVYHDDIGKQVRFIQLIFDHFKAKLSSKRNPIGVEMGEGFLLCFESLTKFVTFKIVERHWFDKFSLSGKPNKPNCEGFDERWKEVRQRTMFRLTSSNELTRRLLTRMYKKKLEKFCSEGEKVKKKLNKKYSNRVYDLNEMATTTTTQ